MEIDLSRITLGQFKPTDVDDFMLWAGDEQVTRSLGWNTFTSGEEALTYIKDVCIPHPWRRSICIYDRSIGFVSIFPGSGDDRCRADIGYAIAVKYWGHGIASKAVSAVSGKIRRRTCYECGEKGHLSSACLKKTADQTMVTGKVSDNAGSGTGNFADNTGLGTINVSDNTGLSAVSGKIRRRTCYECGEKGHLSSACPKKTADQTNSTTIQVEQL